jgi:hypothetical protein
VKFVSIGDDHDAVSRVRVERNDGKTHDVVAISVSRAAGLRGAIRSLFQSDESFGAPRRAWQQP